MREIGHVHSLGPKIPKITEKIPTDYTYTKDDGNKNTMLMTEKCMIKENVNKMNENVNMMNENVNAHVT